MKRQKICHWTTVIAGVLCCAGAFQQQTARAELSVVNWVGDYLPSTPSLPYGCDLRIARCREIEKVVYVKRGVPPDNVCSHTNTTGKDASYGRSGYSKDAGLCNSQGHRFLLADDADGGTVPDVDRSRSRVPEAGHGP